MNKENTLDELFEEYSIQRETYLACNCRSGSCGVCLHIENRMKELKSKIIKQIQAETINDIVEIAHRDGKEFYFGCGADISVNLTKFMMSILAYKKEKGISLEITKE